MSLQPIPKGETITGAITKEMDRRFLSSIDLMGQGKVKLTIDHLEKHSELAFGNGNKEKNAILCYFRETKKPLMLCTTNIKAIISILGTTKVEDWEGKPITLEVQMIRAFGKNTPAVRVTQ